MSVRIDPITGSIVGMSGSTGGNVPNLTPAQHDQANWADEFAADVLPLIDSGKHWFTAYEIRQMPAWLDGLVEVGVITKHKSKKHDGHYYKTIPRLTRAFCLTALALRQERFKRMAERTEGNGPS